MAGPKPSEKEKMDAALAEGNGQPKRVEWNGLTLGLPAELPGDTLWGWAATEDESKSIGPAMGLLRSILGDEQDAQVRAKVTELGLSLSGATEAILHKDDGLFALVLKEYGTDPGESSASDGS
jgi:hypothetical protein